MSTNKGSKCDIDVTEEKQAIPEKIGPQLGLAQMFVDMTTRQASEPQKIAVATNSDPSVNQAVCAPQLTAGAPATTFLSCATYVIQHKEFVGESTGEIDSSDMAEPYIIEVPEQGKHSTLPITVNSLNENLKYPSQIVGHETSGAAPESSVSGSRLNEHEAPTKSSAEIQKEGFPVEINRYIDYDNYDHASSGYDTEQVSNQGSSVNLLGNIVNANNSGIVRDGNITSKYPGSDASQINPGIGTSNSAYLKESNKEEVEVEVQEENQEEEEVEDEEETGPYVSYDPSEFGIIYPYSTFLLPQKTVTVPIMSKYDSKVAYPGAESSNRGVQILKKEEAISKLVSEGNINSSSFLSLQSSTTGDEFQFKAPNSKVPAIVPTETMCDISDFNTIEKNISDAYVGAHAASTSAALGCNEAPMRTIISQKGKLEPSTSQVAKWHDVGIIKGTSCRVTSYYVNNKEEREDLGSTTSDNIPDHSLMASIPLEPGIYYKFRVAALNSCGISEFSNVSVLKTSTPDFPDHPTDFKLSTESSKNESLVLSWKPPQNTLGKTLEYTVYLALRDHPILSKTASTAGTSAKQTALKCVYCGVTNQCELPYSLLSKALIVATLKPAIILRIETRNKMGNVKCTKAMCILEDSIVEKFGEKQ